MYCPKCGQQQVSDEMRFCSRCGFQLEAISALITGGALPTPTFAANTDVAKPTHSKRGARQGAKLMFAGGVLLPITFGFSIVIDSAVPLVIPLTVFLAGLAWLLYWRLFGEETEPQGFQQPLIQGRTQQTFLPAHHSIPAANVNKMPASTAEMAQPPSVTEHTTRLLDAEEGKS